MKARAGKAVQKVSGNRFTRRKADRVNNAVETAPGASQALSHCLNLLIVTHIHLEHEVTAEFGGKTGNAVLKALAHITEGKFRTFTVTGFGNTVGNRTVGEDACDQKALTG